VLVVDSLEKRQSGLLISKKVVKLKPVSMKLEQDQREILIGLLLGGTQMESHAQKGVHIVHFKFQEDSNSYSVLRTHIHERFFEWLPSVYRSFSDESEIPYRFLTIPHSYFSDDAFWKIIEPYVLDSFASSTIQVSDGISSDGSQYNDSDYEDDAGRSDTESEE
jgi:hypothetical protein